MVITTYFPVFSHSKHALTVLDDNLQPIGRVQQVDTDARKAVVREDDTGTEKMIPYHCLCWIPASEEHAEKIYRELPEELHKFVMSPGGSPEEYTEKLRSLV
jgi:hypothetical protein